MNLVVNPAALHCHSLRNDYPVLIELGSSDDAVRYFANVKATQDPQRFELCLHEDALLLDMVRLKRCINVNIVDNNYRFNALLKIENNNVFIDVKEPFIGEVLREGIFFIT